MNNLILALDFGGTKLSAAICKRGEWQWLAHRRIFTPISADGPYEFAAMLKIAKELIAETAEPIAIGVSFGGPVDPSRGIVRLSHHVANWENFPLQAKLEAEFGVPVRIDNDANIAALGEYRFGAGRGCRNLLYVTVSTGIGGGWVIKGKPYHGFNGMAGEIGHIVVNPGGMACVCGKNGCLEAEACGSAIAKRARLKIEAAPAAGLQLLELTGQTVDTLNAQHISRAAEQGNSLAQQILVESAQMLGKGLGNAITLMNPDKVILGGGVAKSGELWRNTVCETARAYTLPEIPVDIVPAHLGDDAPLWGAVALVEKLADLIARCKTDRK